MAAVLGGAGRGEAGATLGPGVELLLLGRGWQQAAAARLERLAGGLSQGDR